MMIKISNDFTKTPGGRFINEGPNSGEKFREDILENKYMEAKSNGEQLYVDLDDCYAFPPSFLEESFGGLVRKLKDKNILTIIKIISNDEPRLIEKISEIVTKVIIDEKI